MKMFGNIKMLKPKKGFTLIELLVVVAIIAVLISLLLPALGKARYYAKLVKCSNGQRQIGTSLYLYTQDYKDKIPTGNYCNFPWMGRFLTSNPIFVGKLLESYLVDTPKYFYCELDANRLGQQAKNKWVYETVGGTSGQTAYSTSYFYFGNYSYDGLIDGFPRNLNEDRAKLFQDMFVLPVWDFYSFAHIPVNSLYTDCSVITQTVENLKQYVRPGGTCTWW